MCGRFSMVMNRVCWIVRVVDVVLCRRSSISPVRRHLIPIDARATGSHTAIRRAQVRLMAAS